jgi:signal transduction histidine kinase
VFQPEELELAQALAHQAMLAMQLSRLSAQSRQAAVLAERNRLARDLHDTLAQGFTGVIMQLEAAKGALAAQAGGNPAWAHIERAEALARTSLGEARRSVRAMRPRSLMGVTLSNALEDLLKRMTNGTPLQAEFLAEGEPRAIPPEREEGLLRIAQESLTNTLKYAQARRFRATLSFAADSLRLQLVDDGRGFDPHAEHDGFGLPGMKERTDAMAGNFVLRSEPGQGTEIVVTLNLPNTTNPTSGNHA